MSGAFSLRQLVMALLVLPMGYLADRYGPRRVLLPCFLCYGLGYGGLAWVTTLWQLYLTQGFLIGVATAGPFLCVVSTVGKWHDRGRGKALGLAAIGTGLGSVIFPSLSASLIEALDWRAATVVIGLIVVTIGVSGSMVMRNPPNSGPEPPPGGRSVTSGSLQVYGKLLPLLRGPGFLTIGVLFFFFYLASMLVISHFVNYATDAGGEPVIAAAMMSALGLAGLTGRLGMGALSDRIGVKHSVVAGCALVAAGTLMLSWKPPGPLMWFSVVLFGFGFGSEAPLIPGLMGERYGTRHLGTTTATLLVWNFLGGTVGPWLGGAIFDISNSYTWALLLSAGFAATSLVLAICLRPATQKDKDMVRDFLER